MVYLKLTSVVGHCELRLRVVHQHQVDSDKYIYLLRTILPFFFLFILLFILNY
jgi:hypothetical protein